VSTIVTNEDLGASKTREDYLLEEPNYHSGVINGASNGLHPLRDEVDDEQDILVATGGLERTHEIDLPYIKDFDFKYVV